MSKVPHHVMLCLVLPSTTYVVSEIVATHTTYLSGTFGGGGGGNTKSRLSGVAQMKYKAHFCGWSNAALALTMEQVSQLDPDVRATLSALPKSIPSNTKPRRIEEVLGGVPETIRPTEADVHARVSALVEAVACVLHHADDTGDEMTLEEAEAEYGRIQGLKGALYRRPPSDLHQLMLAQQPLARNTQRLHPCVGLRAPAQALSRRRALAQARPRAAACTAASFRPSAPTSTRAAASQERAPPSCPEALLCGLACGLACGGLHCNLRGAVCVLVTPNPFSPAGMCTACGLRSASCDASPRRHTPRSAARSSTDCCSQAR